MAEFRMPSLGADMDAGTLLEWLVHPGDTVHRGDIVAVVDTSKAAIEVECFTGGVVEKLLVEPGTRVPVGTVLATIAPAGAPAAPAGPPVATGPSPVTSPLVRRLATERQVDLVAIRGTGPGGRITHADVERATAPARAPAAPARVAASPLARRTAAGLGVDLATVTGTGPGGTVSVDDVRRAAAVAPRPATEPAAEPATGAATEPATARAEAARRQEQMRATIAARMARSKREIPHYYLTETVELGAAMDWLHGQNRSRPVPDRLVPAALLLKAAARAAAAVPGLNGFWQEDRFVPGAGVHLGVAISLRGGGLVAPAIHHADRLAVPDLMAALKDLVARTRAGRLRGAELSDPTITVSNLGEQGVESILGVIYPPQVALVGFGRVTDRAWAVGGLLGVRPAVTVSLAADHRVTDGATGARYLQAITQLLHRPEEL
jgi:pyruvate dehydrogenase E2 component (dihydrolipoamide acetyltransferase)